MTTTSWALARENFAALLSLVSITTPVSTQIKVVYEWEPELIGDFPCVVMAGADKDVSRGPGSYRSKVYDLHFFVVVRDSDVGTAGAMLDAFGEAIIDTVDAHLKVGLSDGSYRVTQGPRFTQPQRVMMGGGEHDAIEGVITIAMTDAVAFGV